MVVSLVMNLHVEPAISNWPVTQYYHALQRVMAADDSSALIRALSLPVGGNG